MSNKKKVPTKTQKLNVYEYPLNNGNGYEYMGSYTIKEGVQPLGFKDEKLVDSFEMEIE